MNDQSQFAREYAAALAFPVSANRGATRDPPEKAALARAHELRKFEIENYWKRATYFWAFQLAAFTLLGLIWPKTIDPTGSLQGSVLMVPAGLGAITALVGWLTAKGSKFWQENWEAHVDALEDAIEGRLTQVIFVKKRVEFSVSRVNERLFLLLMIGWLVVFVIVALHLDDHIPENWYGPLGFIALLLSGGIIVVNTGTDLKGLQIAPDGSWAPTNTAARNAPNPPRLILRNTLLHPARPPAPSNNHEGPIDDPA